jgi:hypothetical protein
MHIPLNKTTAVVTLALTGAVLFGSFTLLAAVKATKLRWSEEVYVRIPKTLSERIKDPEKFKNAIEKHSGIYSSTKRKHRIKWKPSEDAPIGWLKGGLEKNDIAGGEHDPGENEKALYVAQRVAFDSMAELKAFAEEVDPLVTGDGKGGAPSPKKP